jgi:hypothetical protein
MDPHGSWYILVDPRRSRWILMDPRIHQDPIFTPWPNSMRKRRILVDPRESTRIHEDPRGSTRIDQDPLGSGDPGSAFSPLAKLASIYTVNITIKYCGLLVYSVYMFLFGLQ